jgi:hypothetical protein
VFESAAQVEALLSGYDFLTWHSFRVGHLRARARRHMRFLGLVPTVRLRGAAAQAEQYHPLLHSFIIDVLRTFGITLPRAYQRAREVPFGNY